jgi:transcriptional regulator with GAF, ATPase, and Fis domain
VDGSLQVTEADMGWVLLPEEDDPQLYLRAQRNLPRSLASKLHQPWDDGVSPLVMLSGESLEIHGEGLSKFKLARFGEAALLAPIKVRDKSIGVIAVSRNAPLPFSEREKKMLEAVADYASISLVNSRLFQAIEARAQRLQQMIDEANMDARRREKWRAGLDRGLRAALSQVERLLKKVKEPKLLRDLETVNRDIVALLQEIAEVSGSDSDQESLSSES